MRYKRFTFTILVLTSCVLMGCGLDTYTSPLAETSTQEAIANRVSAPWSVQLQSAQEFAKKLDGNAFLTQVKVERGLSNPPGDYSSLHIRFRFVSDSAEYWITFDDTDVASTIKRRGGSDNGSHDLPSPSQQEILQKTLSTIQVSPSEALKQTLPIAQAHGLLDPQVSAEMDMRLLLDRIPAAWSVLYTTPIQNADVKSLLVEVNAHTSEIIRTSKD